MSFYIEQEFESYEELLKRLKEFETKTALNYCVDDSTSLSRARKKQPNKTFKEDLKYSYIKYNCQHHGTYHPKGAGVRPNQKSFKRECPATIVICANKAGNRLVVRKINDEHHHEITENVTLELGAKRTKMKKHLFEKTRCEVTSVDIQNVRTRIRKMKKKDQSVRVEEIFESEMVSLDCGHNEDVISTASNPSYNYETLTVSQKQDFVWHVEINRPDRLNAMNSKFFSEISSCFQKLRNESECRSVVLSAAGRLFSAGLDFSTLMELAQNQDIDDIGRRTLKYRTLIKEWQDSFTSIEQCNKPVVAAIHNACIGAGVDLISACDIRYLSQDGFFQIKEVDIGITADLGTIQRLPKMVGNDSLMRELVYTARKIFSDEALKFGMISKVFESKEATVAGALETASVIAKKSPIAVQGAKMALNYSRDHSVTDSLEHILTWNSSMVMSEDVVKAAQAVIEKSSPIFSKV